MMTRNSKATLIAPKLATGSIKQLKEVIAVGFKGNYKVYFFFDGVTETSKSLVAWAEKLAGTVS